MVASPRTGGLKRLASCALALAAIPCWPPADAQPRMSLAQVSERQAPAYTPLYAGQVVTVRGIVSARAYHFPTYTVLPLQEAGQGGALEVPGAGAELSAYQPGDELEVVGTVSGLSGMVVVVPAQIGVVGHQPPPKPVEVPAEDLIGFSELGKLVRAEMRIAEIGESTAGAFLQVVTRKGDYRIFLPHKEGVRAGSLAHLNVGDTVAATGIAFQYCTTPPYNRWFEILVSDPSQLTRTGRSWIISPWTVGGGLGGLLVLGFIFWRRDRKLDTQRERLRKSYQLGEVILGAPTIEAILTEISTTLPDILGVTRVHLYVYNRGSKTLDAMVPAGQQPVSISLSSPPGGVQAGAVACFHYRTLLVIPDIDRSPFPITPGPGQSPPKSLLFVPMLPQGEMVGVLELDQDDRARDFSSDEQNLAQHLGNQIGVAIRLLDQRTVQEQLFRTEKLAAVGRLISSVVNELKTPLASIVELAQRATSRSMDREFAAIAAEARKASAIVSRLVSFAAADQGDVHPICITTLLRNLIEFRERDWKASGIRVQDMTSTEPLHVLGSHGQLEQAFLTLLVHAEQCLAEAPEKSIAIRTSVLARRLLVEFAFSAPPDGRTPQETAMVLAVTRSVVAGHGGEVRLIEKPNLQPRFEVELPLVARERTTVNGAVPPAPSIRETSRRATALVIDPDEEVQRQLVGLMAARGYRVVPVDNADTGLDLAQRMRFELAFCSVHAPGLNWVELSERLQVRLSGFILLSDRYDPELAADFEGEGRFVMAKPLQDTEVDRVLRSIDAPVAVRE